MTEIATHVGRRYKLPSGNQLVSIQTQKSSDFQGVVVVIIACTIVGFYLWGLDQIFRPLVDRVLL